MTKIGSLNSQPANNLPQTEAPKRNEKVLQAAKMYEEMFLREMVKEMRKSVDKSDLIKEGMGEQIYQEQLDDQYVEQWSAKGGTGMADLIYDHVMDRYGYMYGGKKIQKPSGPIPINPEKNLNPIKIERQPVKNETTTYKINTGSLERKELTSPWSGQVVSLNALDSKMSSLQINHDNGLKSTFLFPGTNIAMTNGQKIAEGQKIGLLNATEFIWRISPV